MPNEPNFGTLTGPFEYPETWIGAFHRRVHGHSNAVDVQYELVKQLSSQLSSRSCQTTPEMLHAEVDTLVGMYEHLTTIYSGLNLALLDPACFILIDKLIELKLDFQPHENPIWVCIRTLFTQLSAPWRTLAVIQGIYCGYSRAIEVYLDTGIPIDQQTDTGMSFLHLAVKYASQDTVQLLIQKGVDVHAINPTNGWNALHYAVSTLDEGRDTLRLLLDTCPSAMIHWKDNSDMSALDIAWGKKSWQFEALQAKAR